MKLFAIIILLISFSIFAQTPAPIDPCANFIETYCPKQKGTKGIERWTCLAKQYEVLSKNCKTALEAETVREPCFISTVKFCPQSIKNSQDRKNMICLKEHQNKLTEVCKESLAKRPDANQIKNKINEVCAEDEAKFCKGMVQPELKNCLEKAFNENKVSQSCKDLLKKFKRKK